MGISTVSVRVDQLLTVEIGDKKEGSTSAYVRTSPLEERAVP